MTCLLSLSFLSYLFYIFIFYPKPVKEEANLSLLSMFSLTLRNDFLKKFKTGALQCSWLNTVTGSSSIRTTMPLPYHTPNFLSASLTAECHVPWVPCGYYVRKPAGAEFTHSFKPIQRIFHLMYLQLQPTHKNVT